MKKILSLLLALTLAFFAACSGTPAEEFSDMLAKQSAIESGTASGAARITLSNELVKTEIAGVSITKPKSEDVILEFLFNAEVDEANKKAKITLFNQDESHLADVFVDSGKYYLEMENLFKLFNDKTGGKLAFTKKDMKQQKFLNIPHAGWQPHLSALYNALMTAVSEDESIVQENDDYYSLTLTSPAFASALTFPFKEWMANGYTLLYAMVKADHAQALTLTIPDYIKIEMQWSMTAGKVDVATPEGILVSNVLEKKISADNETDKEDEKAETPVEPEKPAKEPKNSSKEPEKDDEATPPEEKTVLTEKTTETSVKAVLNGVIKNVAEDRKLLTAGLFNEDSNLNTLMDSTAKWLSPLQECYRQSEGSYTYLGLTSLPHENCLPSERDAVNINFYKMRGERKLEIFIEYDEPNAIKKQLDTFIDTCEKCGYTLDKEELIRVIDIMQRDVKLLVKGTERDYYMEEVKVGNVNLSAYAAFAGDRYIYMITLDESK